MDEKGNLELYYSHNTDKDLEQVAKDLEPFIDALIKEVARHVPEKGYTYKETQYRQYLAEAGNSRAYDYMVDQRVAMAGDSPHRNPGEALDAAAFLAFSWLHETGKIKDSSK